MCVYIYTYWAQYGDGGRSKRNKKEIGSVVNAA